MALDFKKTGQNKWKCEKCKFEVSIIDLEDEKDDVVDVDVPMKSMMEQMERVLLKHFEPFKQELKEIKSNMKLMEKDIRNLKESYEDTKIVCQKNNKVLSDIGKRVSKLENNLDVNVNSIIHEIEERKRRETSTIGHNILESDKSSGVERQLDDKSRFIQLLPDECEIKNEDFKINRIGKATDRKIRPVKIELITKELARSVLRAKLKDDSVRLKSDLTSSQRDKLSKLRNELKMREEDGKKNLIIRYQSGEPFIDKKYFRQAQHTIREK